jgi:hypothetical protein
MWKSSPFLSEVLEGGIKGRDMCLMSWAGLLTMLQGLDISEGHTQLENILFWTFQ